MPKPIIHVAKSQIQVLHNLHKDFPDDISEVFERELTAYVWVLSPLETEFFADLLTEENIVFSITTDNAYNQFRNRSQKKEG